jgi:uncharacterized protein DUF3303
MLVVVNYRPKANLPTEESEKRLLQLFANWEPAEGTDIKAHYGFSDGGGVWIADVESADAIIDTGQRFGVFFDLTVNPAVEIETMIGIGQQVIAWRASVS